MQLAQVIAEPPLAAARPMRLAPHSRVAPCSIGHAPRTRVHPQKSRPRNLTMQTVLYARVSTAEQNIEHQEAQARAAGFNIDLTIKDDGVSAVSTKLAERPEGRRLFDILRRGDV